MKNASAFVAILSISLGFGLSQARPAFASESAAQVSNLGLSDEFFQSGQYFRAARYAFAAQLENSSLESQAYSRISRALIKARLFQSASYFFIRTLQTKDDASIRKVLADAEILMLQVGPDLVRGYLAKFTQAGQYDSANRAAFEYSLAKAALLDGREQEAIAHIALISKQSSLWPFALQLRATSHAILGKNEQAKADFKECAEQAVSLPESIEDSDSESVKRNFSLEVEDLQYRCQAGLARTLYQSGDFDQADREYDRISKSSFVWTDILFEQAWNAFAKADFNRALGKLVTYESPSLKFVHNSEVDVLRAQSYLALCLYQYAGQTIEQFESRYTSLAAEVKQFVEKNQDNLLTFYDFGKKAYDSPLHTAQQLNRLLNRFVRSPYFHGLIKQEESVASEKVAISRFDRMQPGVDHSMKKGFPGFLNEVVAWRLGSIRKLGGAFVKNSLLDYHSILISDFEKIAFIKLEMLNREKQSLISKKINPNVGERSLGSDSRERRADQYLWSFNGEFWIDELGDYIFSLESQCKGPKG